MTLRKCFTVFFILLLFLIFIFQTIFAQYFIRMTDQQKIQLTLDMIRKGVQHQDTSKIAMVSAPSLNVKQNSFQVSGVLNKSFQDIFNSSSKRKLPLRKPKFKQINPLNFSNFWDFDILNLKIKVMKDSAIVDCELVLWGAESEPGSKDTGRKTKEIFYFKSPARKQSSLSVQEEGGTFNNRGKNPTRTWLLVGFENLLDFLRREIIAKDSIYLEIKKEGK